jgi:peptidoglycan/xylan/chitin deacetylase (PgdA/CDA1 family)
MARALSLPKAWPGAASAAVSLSFDVDTDAAWRGFNGDGIAERLALMSQMRYGAVRGVPRVLAALAATDVRATFFVPGATALAYPDLVRRILSEGHEVGHHGHHHLAPHKISVAQQREEIERGLEALTPLIGAAPVGYRAPFAEITPETLALLVEHGIGYDSSCMGDDRPYVEEAGASAILELPIEWRLDDAPFMLKTEDDGSLDHAGDVLRQWSEEIDQAADERRSTTIVMHPEIIGRGARVVHLETLIREARERHALWLAPLAEVAAHLRDEGIEP